ncbi:MAG: pantoate--beta-alanine ligase [Magnetococcus sp. YQC-5]
MDSIPETSSPSMPVLTDLASLRRWIADCRAQGEQIGFVPTMGALHPGHLALLQAARNATQRVVVSIFVNPTQFGPQEDFARYPRTLEQDRALLEKAGCDALFLPDAALMYPPGFQTTVQVEPLGSDLCGRTRPGHFAGVALVVTLLLHMVQPDVIVLGLKDYQQFVLLRRLVQDLAMPIQVVGVPTVRESDGLALSSRNRYLDEKQRHQARCLYQALVAARDMRRSGQTDPLVLEETARQILEASGVDVVEYVALRDQVTLLPVTRIQEDPVLLMAVKLGTTRLIDNMVLSVAD